MDQHELAAMHAMAAELLELAIKTGDPEALDYVEEQRRTIQEQDDERREVMALDLLGVL